MNDWQTFRALLAEEAQLLDDLAAAASALTGALTAGSPEAIEAAERRLEAQRVRHAGASAQRIAMQRRGFGTFTLAQVCARAPRSLRGGFTALLRQMTARGIALRLTVANNKALIVAGLERMQRTIALVQRAGTEQPGTYRRRGIVPAADGSVLVSRRA